MVLLFQIISGEVDIPMDPEYLEEGRRGQYKHLGYKWQQYQHSYYPETIRDWNALSANVKASKSVMAFKSNLLKNYYKPWLGTKPPSCDILKEFSSYSTETETSKL